ncbi:MAG: hypothetical protein WCO04_08080 [Pseudomonadota bacterium]
MIKFITFGDGSKGLLDASKRIAREASKTGLFDEVHRYDFDVLHRRLPNFWSKHGKFILENRRGAGYWIWKAHIIQAEMNNSRDGDVLMYCDAGCGIDNRLKLNFSKINPDTFDLTLFELDNHTIESWTNQFTLHAMGVTKQTSSENLFAGGVILLRNGEPARNLVKCWIECCEEDESACLIDRNDLEPRIFREHRHDQSILSILTRAAISQNFLKVKSIPVTFIETDGSGIRAYRNKSGYPGSLVQNRIFKLIYNIKNYLLRE